VNNAGISSKRKGGILLKVLDIENGDWDKVMSINLKKIFNCVNAVIPFMIGQRYGKMVYIGSIAGLTERTSGFPLAHHYFFNARSYLPCESAGKRIG
jgi:3-oxoacyl-[acyl-carrier protein] reductase